MWGWPTRKRLHQALAAKETYDFLGSPEGELALAQAAVYIATAPKSNALYTAYKAAIAAGQGDGVAGAAQDHSQCADETDEAAGVWRGLHV